MLDSPAPIIRVVPHDDSDARRLRQALLRAAIYPSFTRYGNGPAAFRFVVSSAHTPAQVDRLASVLAAPV